MTSTDKDLRERSERAFADHGYKFERYSNDQVWGGQYTSCVVESAWEGYHAAHAEAQAEIEALRKDAERYRAIRDGIGVVEWKAITGTLIGMLPNGDKLDRAIDDSMASEVSSNGQ